MSLTKPLLGLTVFLVLLGFFYSTPRERPRNNRERLRTNVPPDSYKITIHSRTSNNRSTFVIDLPPGVYLDNELNCIPYDFTVRDRDGRDVRFRGNLRLVREDEDTFIATPDRDLAYVTGELLAHVVDHLNQLIERRMNTLQNFTEGYDEARRRKR
jgi:hypothetical protein